MIFSIFRTSIYFFTVFFFMILEQFSALLMCFYPMFDDFWRSLFNFLHFSRIFVNFSIKFRCCVGPIYNKFLSGLINFFLCSFLKFFQNFQRFLTNFDLYFSTSFCDVWSILARFSSIFNDFFHITDQYHIFFNNFR